MTRAQDIYLGYLCVQAGLNVVGVGDTLRCYDAGPISRNWSLIVQAGMNDIDQRCDAYLAWLDDRRRSHAPLLAEVSAVRTATTSIMAFSGVEKGAVAISVVGEAFGLATNTFNNLHSRLLLEVNQATVQSVVVNRRNGYRLDIMRVDISNRPAAVHALRSYLNICMPFTIETDINTTVTAFQFGGPDALIRPPLNSPDTVKGSVVHTAVAVAPRQSIAPPSRAPAPAIPEFAEIFEEYNPKVDTLSRLKLIQKALCVPDSEIGKIGPLTKAHIGIFEETYPPSRRSARLNGKLDEDEITAILGQKGTCGGIGSNYFERQTFTSTATLSQLIGDLQRFDAGKNLTTASTVADMRAAIRAVREDPKIKPKLKLPLPDKLSDQVTRDLWQALRNTQ